MSTVYPEEIQTFPTMTNLTASDMANVKAYQEAMQEGDFVLAKRYFDLIQNVNNKVVNAEYLNTITDTMVALQTYFEQKWSPSYIVSTSQPTVQDTDDFWIKVL